MRAKRMGQVIAKLPLNSGVIEFDYIQQKGLDMAIAKKAMCAGKKQGTKSKKAAVGKSAYCAMHKKNNFCPAEQLKRMPETGVILLQEERDGSDLIM